MTRSIVDSISVAERLAKVYGELGDSSLVLDADISMPSCTVALRKLEKAAERLVTES